MTQSETDLAQAEKEVVPGSIAFPKSKSRMGDKTVGWTMLIPLARLAGEISIAHLGSADQASWHPEACSTLKSQGAQESLSWREGEVSWACGCTGAGRQVQLNPNLDSLIRW